MANLYQRLVERLFGGEIQRRVDLAMRSLDDAHDNRIAGARDTFPRDRRAADREEVLQDALEAWRVNPLARRIVGMTSQYVVGGGLGIESKHEATHQFLQEWWHHRLNRMPIRAFELCEELSRSGNLFLALSTDPSGMSYVRAIPAIDILDIETAENDVEQPVWVIEKPDLGSASLLEGRRWKVYDEKSDTQNPDGSFPAVMLHYAVNRPVGGKWGESDLAPLLRWLSRYASWLEDRARLNRYRNTFLFWIKARFNSQAERLARQAELNNNPPNPGSILVTDETETWSVLSPNLASFEAAEDGLALKKMIAVGSGNPMHFLAEPEGATRTTAESSGGPTFRHYEQRQLYFLWMIADLARVVVSRRAMVDRRVSKRAEIRASGTDISARDNASLATAASVVTAAFLQLRSLNLIDDAELLRMVYRFSGEVVDVEQLLGRGAAAPRWTNSPAAGEATASQIKINPVRIGPGTGEPTNV